METPDGRAFHTFLCGRPLPGRFRTLGRESGMATCVLQDDCLYLVAGGMVPPMDLPLDVWRMRHVFDSTVLPIDFQWLRTPVPDRLFRLMAQEHLACTAETVVIADPPNWQRATARGMG